jgi:hypothetical protein
VRASVWYVIASPVVATARPPGLSRSFGRLRLLECALVAALVAGAALIRRVDLWSIPIFTDEGDEIGLALRIVRDGARPLTNDDPYLGPLFNYLLAGLFWVAGPGPWLPRALVLALGACTIVPTYLLARELGLGVGATRGRAILAGSLAAGLLAVNAGHVVVNSHVAWGNCLTPLLTTTACWLLARAARPDTRLSTRSGVRQDARPVDGLARAADDPSGAGRTNGIVRGVTAGVTAGVATGVTDGAWAAGGGVALVLACVTFGLALQTHPSVAALLPGAAVFVAWRPRRWLSRPWPYVGAGLVLAVQAPTLLYVAREGLAGWVDAILEKQEMYDGAESLGLSALLERLGPATHALGASLGGLLNDRDTPLPPAWHPAVVLALVLAALALIWLARRRQPLPALVALSGLLVLPLVNGKYAPLVSNTRYLAPLVAVLIASIAAWSACALADARAPLGAGGAAGGAAGVRRQLRRLGRLAPLAAALVLASGSAISLVSFYVDAHRDGRTNDHLLAALTALEAAYRPGDVVIVDRAMYRDWTLTEGRLQRVFDSWLELRGIPHRVVEVEDEGRLRTDLIERGGLAILSRRTAPAVTRVYQLDEIAGDADPRAPAGTGYSIVRLHRAGA